MSLGVTVNMAAHDAEPGWTVTGSAPAGRATPITPAKTTASTANTARARMSIPFPLWDKGRFVAFA